MTQRFSSPRGSGKRHPQHPRAQVTHPAPALWVGTPWEPLPRQPPKGSATRSPSFPAEPGSNVAGHHSGVKSPSPRQSSHRQPRAPAPRTRCPGPLPLGHPWGPLAQNPHFSAASPAAPREGAPVPEPGKASSTHPRSSRLTPRTSSPHSAPGSTPQAPGCGSAALPARPWAQQRWPRGTPGSYWPVRGRR